MGFDWSLYGLTLSFLGSTSMQLPATLSSFNKFLTTHALTVTSSIDLYTAHKQFVMLVQVHLRVLAKSLIPVADCIYYQSQYIHSNLLTKAQ